LSPPGTVLVSRQGRHHLGFLQQSFITRITGGLGQTWSLNVFSWTFDGKFKENVGTLSMPVDEIGKVPKQIASLSFYPLKYAEKRIADLLHNRGHIFWRCRKSAYVTYKGPDMNWELSYVSTPIEV
jgi:hypothetical protein